MRKIQLVDLDGCISDDRWRRELIREEGDPFDRFHAYHLGLHRDAAVNLHEIDPDLDVVVVTARPCLYAEMTLDWLREVAGIQPRYILHRNNHDHRPSVEVKREQVGWLFSYNLNYNVNPEDIAAAIDDREDIINMYREHFSFPARIVRIGAEEGR